MKSPLVLLVCLFSSTAAWAQPKAPAGAEAPMTTPMATPPPAGGEVSTPAPTAAPEPSRSEALAPQAPAPEPVRAEASASFSLSGEGETDGYAGGSGLSHGRADAGRGVQLGALAGFGLSFDDNVGSVNSMGPAFGGSAGGHLGDLYLGARALFYLGSGSDLPTGRLSMREWLLAAEFGYAIDLGTALVLRPSLPIGAGFFVQDGPSRSTAGGFIPGTQDRSRTRFYLGPGATLLLPFGRLTGDLAWLYAGLDVRVGLFLGDPTSFGLETSLTLGVEL